VWEAIHDSARWPQWWRGVEKVVELEPAGEDGTGQLARYTWKSRLPQRGGGTGAAPRRAARHGERRQRHDLSALG
jgi:hypothetical protein